MTYDAESVRGYFDAFGEREWQRLEMNFQGRSSYAVHRHILEDYVEADYHVLDVGSGPGRFAIDVAAMGYRIMVHPRVRCAHLCREVLAYEAAFAATLPAA